MTGQSIDFCLPPFACNEPPGLPATLRVMTNEATVWAKNLESAK